MTRTSAEELEEGVMAEASPTDFRGTASEAELLRFDVEGCGSGFRIFLCSELSDLICLKRVNVVAHVFSLGSA